MKRKRDIPKNLNKFIKIGETPVTSSTTSVSHLMSPTYPCSLIGLRWNIVQQPASSLSLNTTVQWAIVVHDFDANPNPNINGGTTGVQDLVDNFSNQEVVASGLLYSFWRETPDIGEVYGVDKDIGKVKTARKMKAGEKLLLLMKSNAVLGNRVHFHINGWLQS